jgi:DnaJ-domain-containing protein 1/Sec-independent protein translocase protein TatA
MNKEFSTDHLRKCYLVLGLTPKASLAEIKQAYRDLSQIWHPDRYTHNLRLQKKAVAQFQIINSAYSILIHHLTPEIISIESLEIQLAEEKSLVEREIKKQSPLKQKIQKSISLGTLLMIPAIFVCGLFLFAPELRKLIRLPDLQKQIKELQNQQKNVESELKWKTSSIDRENQTLESIKQENKSLKSKNQEMEDKLESASQNLKQMQQRIDELVSSSGSSSSDSTDRHTSEKTVRFRNDFKKMVVGKTKQEVIAAVGKPDSTSESQLSFAMIAYWKYSEQVKDPASGNIGGAEVHFTNGKVDSVDFADFY